MEMAAPFRIILTLGLPHVPSSWAAPIEPGRVALLLRTCIGEKGFGNEHSSGFRAFGGKH